MSMVVQHNLTANNANRMLGITTNAQASSTEKLSSGYKINRAADDASGLAISEKMRKQIRGLTQASDNAEDGISAVQTAEGALSEVTDMLQRMNELAVKAANGTESESDRQAIQDEIDELVTEIDRVATTTKFNETYLLSGRNATTGEAAGLTYKTAQASLSSYTIDANGQFTIGVTSVTTSTTLTTGVNGVASLSSGTYSTAAANTNITYRKIEATINSQSITYYVIDSASEGTLTTDGSLSVAEIVDAVNSDTATASTIKAFSSMSDLVAQLKQDMGSDVKNIVVDAETDPTSVQLKVSTFADLNNDINLSLHVGADSSEDNKIDMSISQMSARGLGINGLYLGGDDDDAATAAIDTIANAISKVSAQRASLGAVQNRLEHTINNLDNVVENTTSAESQIRDTDMASEMVNYSKYQILQQAGTSMLAQANSSSQNVLSLLG